MERRSFLRGLAAAFVALVARPRIPLALPAPATPPEQPGPALVAPIGALYLRTNGGQGSTVYYKATASPDGWVALGGDGAPTDIRNFTGYTIG